MIGPVLAAPLRIMQVFSNETKCPIIIPEGYTEN